MKKFLFLLSALIAYNGYSLAASPISKAFIKDPNSLIPGAKFTLRISPKFTQGYGGLFGGFVANHVSYVAIMSVLDPFVHNERKKHYAALAGSALSTVALGLAAKKRLGKHFFVGSLLGIAGSNLVLKLF